MKFFKWLFSLFRQKKPETFEVLNKQIEEKILEQHDIQPSEIKSISIETAKELSETFDINYSLPEIKKMLSDEWKKPKGLRSYQTIRFCYDMKNKLKA